ADEGLIDLGRCDAGPFEQRLGGVGGEIDRGDLGKIAVVGNHRGADPVDEHKVTNVHQSLRLLALERMKIGRSRKSAAPSPYPSRRHGETTRTRLAGPS